VHAIKQVSFIFTAASNLKPGEYSLMLGAQNREVGILKAVKAQLIS
jgi:virginiamycin B lyase